MPDNAFQLPTEIDTTIAHEARVYDYWLGGKENYPADRALGDAIAEHVPTIKAMARANRAFLSRAVRHLVADAGITQFLDIGTGIPTAGNTHEVAQQLDSNARVVYVDKDPIVLAHARALMDSTPQGRTRFIHADLHDPRSILENPDLTDTLDLSEPVAIMLVAIMMYFTDDDRPQDIIGTLLEAVPSGSYIVITHPTADFAPEAMAGVVAAAEASGIAFHPRSKSDTSELFSGTTLVDPGLVPVASWRPELIDRPAVVAEAESAWYWAGIGRKP
ncbi:SAM-dependent methyltransferase [Nocardia sp. SYP-A9097]|uniref:SAM-dependent methyltransferase n=1 Tax=Nocardia sp. SYP-A9097 TaxID=2663237 RepID=UPI00129BD10F|nr:SAM-dependent methyltransferase [Nocardia sp. SYP-A9097]MRH90506.1 SAM-dependent methyltransferase [Nocardia sp. SYP-A9097]